MGWGGFLSTTVRLIAQQEAARQRQLEREAKARERQQKAATKAAAFAYANSQAEEVSRLITDVELRVADLKNILVTGLGRKSAVDLGPWSPLRRKYPSLQEIGPAPKLESFLAPKPSILASLVPGTMHRHAIRIRDGQQKHAAAVEVYKAALSERELAYQQAIAEVDQHNESIDRLINNTDPAAITEYLKLVVESAPMPEGFPNRCSVGFLSSSKHIVLDYMLPEITIVPEAASFKFNRQRAKIVAVPRSPSNTKSLYAETLANIALRVLFDLFRAGYDHIFETVTLNGMLDTVDRRTGKRIRICLFSVRTARDEFLSLNLSQVDSLACLKNLKASVSRSPEELLPVKPILELNMSDPRFVASQDVLGTLDRRPNLMDLSPNEFESLITNLFAAMGLETRLTQPSRDGGVDCVAYDPRPILGGKVVIQAKRYKNTVGVSAVRDLFGTVQNEGASKGILVTTSGYGKAAFDFARGKPLELLDGSNLLYLLSEHAKIDAKIEISDDLADKERP